MTRTHSTIYTGFGGGGRGGGVYKHEATIVNYDDSMTINVDGGARGNGVAVPPGMDLQEVLVKSFL